MQGACRHCSDCVCDYPFQKMLKEKGYHLVKKEMYNDRQLTISEKPGGDLSVVMHYKSFLGYPTIDAIGYSLHGEDTASLDERLRTKLVREGGFSYESVDNPLIGECGLYRRNDSYTLSYDDAAKILSEITGEKIEDNDAFPAMDISAEASILLN